MIEWNTFNSFIGVNGEVHYQEGHTDCTMARVTVDGREVFLSNDLNAAYRTFDRLQRGWSTEDLQYARRY